jgi:hypothetical protein
MSFKDLPIFNALWRLLLLFFVGYQFYVLLLSPKAGYPDNGDATRIFNRFDLYKADSINPARGSSRFLVFNYQYREPYFKRHITFYLPRVYQLYIYPALGLSWLMGSRGNFNLSYLAFVNILLYSVGFYFVLIALKRHFPPILGLCIGIVCAPLLLDILFIGYFNSFMPDFPFFATALLAFGVYWSQPKPGWFSALLIFLVCTIKEQYLPGLLALPILFYNGNLSTLWRFIPVLPIMMAFLPGNYANLRENEPGHRVNRFCYGMLQTDGLEQQTILNWFQAKPDQLPVANEPGTHTKALIPAKSFTFNKTFQAGMDTELWYYINHPGNLIRVYFRCWSVFLEANMYPVGNYSISISDYLAGNRNKMVFTWFHFIKTLMPIYLFLLLGLCIGGSLILPGTPTLRLLLVLLAGILGTPLIAFFGDGFIEFPRHCQSINFFAALSLPVSFKVGHQLWDKVALNARELKGVKL